MNVQLPGIDYLIRLQQTHMNTFSCFKAFTYHKERSLEMCTLALSPEFLTAPVLHRVPEKLRRLTEMR